MTTYRFIWVGMGRFYKDIEAHSFREARSIWFEIIHTHKVAHLVKVFELDDDKNIINTVFNRAS